MKWRFGPLSVVVKVAGEEPLLRLKVGLHALFMLYTLTNISCELLFIKLVFINVCLIPTEEATIQITSVTTHSITLVPNPPSGTVYYKEVGSSAQPRRVPYSNTVAITQLQPNTEYNITYVTGNGLGVNRVEINQVTLPTGE